MAVIISGTGSELPVHVVKNDSFLNHTFYDKEGVKNDKPTAEVVAKLEAITGIKERRYIDMHQETIDIAIAASQKAIDDSGIKPEDIGGIIVAANGGNFLKNSYEFKTVPNLAALLKNRLHLSQHHCPSYDILFGCPGWLEGFIQANRFLQLGEAKHVLVCGVEVISRRMDPHDVDSMIMADGCGAAIISLSQDENKGVISHATYSHALEDIDAITLANSNDKELSGQTYFKMNGKEVYRYATTWLPQVVKESLDKANMGIEDVDMFLFHQANAKMLHVIANNIAKLYGVEEGELKAQIPTTIEFLGNTSVATIPTLLDLVMKEQLGEYKIKPGDTVVFASVGAGMHCNSLVYQF